MGLKSFARGARTVGRQVARLLPHWPYPVLRGDLKGARFLHGSLAGAGGGASVFFGLVEPEQTAELARHIAPGMTVFDVGANAGYYTVLAGRRVGPTGQVVAIEPLLSNVQYLARNVEINRLENVAIVMAAVSSHCGMANFTIGENRALGHLSDDGTEIPTGARLSAASALAPMITLDSLVDRIGRRPDLVKIDVEGAEMEVLRGAVNTLSGACCTIFLSVHSDGLRASCRAVLESYGYEMEPISGNADHADEYRCQRRVAPA